MIMKYIKLFENWLTEKKKDGYDYGCVMVYFEFPEMQDLHTKISKEDIFVNPDDPSFGLEDEPHVTLLYGLHSNEIPDEIIWEITKRISFSSLTLHTASAFKNDKFDVLKFDVEGNGLHECNRMLMTLPHTTSYPDYHPHTTIAYLKPGMSDKYVNALKDKTFSVTPGYIVYSKPNGQKITKKI